MTANAGGPEEGGFRCLLDGLKNEYSVIIGPAAADERLQCVLPFDRSGRPVLVILQQMKPEESGKLTWAHAFVEVRSSVSPEDMAREAVNFLLQNTRSRLAKISAVKRTDGDNYDVFVEAEFPVETLTVDGLKHLVGAVVALADKVLPSSLPVTSASAHE